MKILYFSPGYTTHDHRFLSSVSGGGHQVFFVQLEGNTRQLEDRPVPPQVSQVIWKGGRKSFRWGSLLKLVLDFRRLTREIRPDLVHAGPIQTCAFIAILSGFRPVLTMSWGFDLMEDVNRGRWWEFVTQYTLKRSSFFTSDAAVTRERAVHFGMDPEHTVVFPWGVDLEKFTPTNDYRPSTAADRPPSSVTLFCNRSWEPRYGVDLLAQAFVKVARQNQHLDLILLAGGSQAARIRGILQNAGITDRVTYGGQISQKDLPQWYHLADLYISPSHVDGSSVSLMEALACGMPCIVSDIPANREWVTEGENGWVFRDGDVDHLVEKILSAVAKRETLPEIGRVSRRIAELRADWRKNAEVLLNAYQIVLERKANAQL